MSDLGAAGEPVHRSGDRRCASVAAPATGWSALAWMETIMSNTSDELRELRDEEIDAVNGGLVVIAIIAILIGLLVPA